MSKTNPSKHLREMLVPNSKYDFEMMMPFELCKCKHQRKDHGNTIAQGHGRCMYGNGLACPCKKFTFTGRYSNQ